MLKIDKGTFKVIETSEGFLKAKISIARSGVFEYLQSDGSVKRDAKLPEDLFSKTTLDSIIGAPITSQHPNTPDQLVTSENYKELAVGNISNPHIEDDKIVGIATFYDPILIKQIKERNQNEVSIGYKYQSNNQSGSLNGEQYDSADTNIIINHVALVEQGRAGSDIKVHLDNKKLKEGNNMPKLPKVEGEETSNSLTYRKFDGTDIQVSPIILKELQILKNDSKEKSKETISLQAEVKKLQEENKQIKIDNKDNADSKSLQAQLEIANDKSIEWEKKYNELNSSIPEIVEKAAIDKVELVEFAKSIDSEMKVDGLSNKEIKLQIIAKGLPFKEGIKVDSVSNEVIEARFDAACDLMRVKASENNESKNKNEIKIDNSEIEKKKADLLTVYQRSQKSMEVK